MSVSVILQIPQIEPPTQWGSTIFLAVLVILGLAYVVKLLLKYQMDTQQKQMEVQRDTTNKGFKLIADMFKEHFDRREKAEEEGRKAIHADLSALTEGVSNRLENTDRRIDRHEERLDKLESRGPTTFT